MRERLKSRRSRWAGDSGRQSAIQLLWVGFFVLDFCLAVIVGTDVAPALLKWVLLLPVSSLVVFVILGKVAGLAVFLLPRSLRNGPLKGWDSPNPAKPRVRDPFFLFTGICVVGGGFLAWYFVQHP